MLLLILGSKTSNLSYLKDLFAKQASIHGGTFLEHFAGNTSQGLWKKTLTMIKSTLDLSQMCWGTPNDADEKTKNILSLILQRDFDNLQLDEREIVFKAMKPFLIKMAQEVDYLHFSRNCIHDFDA